MKAAHIDAVLRALTALVGAHHCRQLGEADRPTHLEAFARERLAEVIAEVHGVTPGVVVNRLECELGRQQFHAPWQPPASSPRAAA